jgi:hypothetical protein
MSATAVLAVIVAVGEAHTPVTEALIGAAKEAVGSAASVHVTEASNQTDRAVLRVEAALDALAAVSLVWDDDQHLHARTRLHVARSDRWTNRDIAFEAADKPFERGRALGFTIASMLPEAGADIEINLPESFIRREMPTAHDLQVTLMGAGRQGPLRFGGAVAGEWMLTERLAVRAGFTFRQATIEGTPTTTFDATESFAALAAGGCFWLLVPTLDSRLGVGLRADIMGVYLNVRDEFRHQSGSHEYLGADLVVQGTFRVATAVDLLMGVGAETLFRETDYVIVVPPPGKPTPIGSVPAWQVLAEAGMRFRF